MFYKIELFLVLSQFDINQNPMSTINLVDFIEIECIYTFNIHDN